MQLQWFYKLCYCLLLNHYCIILLTFNLFYISLWWIAWNLRLFWFCFSTPQQHCVYTELITLFTYYNCIITLNQSLKPSLLKKMSGHWFEIILDQKKNRKINKHSTYIYTLLYFAAQNYLLSIMHRNSFYSYIIHSLLCVAFPILFISMILLNIGFLNLYLHSEQFVFADCWMICFVFSKVCKFAWIGSLFY